MFLILLFRSRSSDGVQSTYFVGSGWHFSPSMPVEKKEQKAHWVPTGSYCNIPWPRNLLIFLGIPSWISLNLRLNLQFDPNSVGDAGECTAIATESCESHCLDWGHAARPCESWITESIDPKIATFVGVIVSTYCPMRLDCTFQGWRIVQWFHRYFEFFARFLTSERHGLPIANQTTSLGSWECLQLKQVYDFASPTCRVRHCNICTMQI